MTGHHGDTWQIRRMGQARVEADRVAAALREREAGQPGYVERLAVLPRRWQTARIRAEVDPQATTARVWSGRHRRYAVLVDAGGGGTAVGGLPRVEPTGGRLSWWWRRLRLWGLWVVARL